MSNATSTSAVSLPPEELPRIFVSIEFEFAMEAQALVAISLEGSVG